MAKLSRKLDQRSPMLQLWQRSAGQHIRDTLFAHSHLLGQRLDPNLPQLWKYNPIPLVVILVSG